MTEEIDYKALYEGLAGELEEARRRIVELHFAANRVSYLQHLTLTDIRGFVFKNYLLIVVSIMLVSLIISSLKTIKSLFTKP